jgi:chorismate dehydratase
LIFGKIEYLNLLPFHVFMKRYGSNIRYSQVSNYNKGVPSKINEAFIGRRVDSAFISSIKSKKYPHAPLGIIAKKEVLSVLIDTSCAAETDDASATSNILAQILHVKGKVLIGDRALRHYLSAQEAIDLARLWNDTYHLPFVFALLCYHSHRKYMLRMSHEFLKRPVKIPQYLLKESASRTGIAPHEIALYLKFISYDFDTAAQRGLKKFLSLSRTLKQTQASSPQKDLT